MASWQWCALDRSRVAPAPPTRETAFAAGQPRDRLERVTVGDGHVRLFVTLASGRGEVVESLDLLWAQLDTVGCRVLLDAGDPLGAGDRGNVVALGEQPGQRDLRRCGVELGGAGLDLVDDAEVLLEVALGEAGVVLAPVVVGEILGGADRPGEEAVPERRVGHEADAKLAQQR